MRTIIFSILLMLVAPLSMADALDDAKASGQVVEATTGYVQATASASAQVRALVDDINARRREAYERIAQKNQLPVDQVARESYRLRHPE